MKARIIIDQDFVIGDVDPRLFGGFIEHLGRHIYTGIYEPGHPTADDHGFRRDVLALVKELDMPVVRYPGGNFVSGYDWQDGVGPRDQRPHRLDLAWKTTETNQFGTNEFIEWCRKAGTHPMLAVNLGTRGPEEARNLVEYCNHPRGTAWSDLRREHGYADPHGVGLWCLGNEMDGPWQMGHKTAEEYGRIACEAAKLMKWTDPGIELVACGSSGRRMDTFIEWEQTVLQHTFDLVDYLSIHTYYGNTDDNTPRFLAEPDAMDAFIEEVIVACDAVAARRRSSKRIMLSFDEWNVWYHSHKAKKHEPWAIAPAQLEDVYTFEDALCVGGMLISLLNHADRVKIGCLAQVVNVIGPIMTAPGGAAWRQTIFHPFALASRFGRGRVLQSVVDSPVYTAGVAGAVPAIKTAAVWKPGKGELSVFILNRDLEHACDLAIDLRAFGTFDAADWTVLHHTDLKATNTVDAASEVEPIQGDGITIKGSHVSMQLPAASWSVVNLARG